MGNNNREQAIDVFRGLTIAAMILVNNPGSWSTVHAPLLHADWHGITLTDWIFPFFIFIVGVSVTLALGKKKAENVDKKELSKKIVLRTLIIFGIGLFLAAFPNFGMKKNTSSNIQLIWYLLLSIAMLSIFFRAILDQKQFTQAASKQYRNILFWIAATTTLSLLVIGFRHADLSHLRIPGVLQRIAIVYGIIAFIFLYTNVRQQLFLGLGILLFYWALMSLIPIPNGVAPNLEPDTNLGAWLDRLLLTENHLWQYSKNWDPEGLLSTLPAVVTGISGLITGYWIKQAKTIHEKVNGLLAVGLILLVLAFAWDLQFPINKKLWTSSYVLYTSGMAMLVLGMIYWLVDIKSYKKWIKPFQVFGMNALFAYILSTLIAILMYTIQIETVQGESISIQTWIYNHWYTPYLVPKNASLAYAFSNVLIALGVCWIFYRRKIYIKV